MPGIAAPFTKSAGGLKTRFSCFNGSMLHSPLLNNQYFLRYKTRKMTQNDGFSPSRLSKISENTWDLLYGKPLK
jgi:hypothetical protein